MPIPAPDPKQVALQAEDWIEYRTGFATLIRKFLFRKVPPTGCLIFILTMMMGLTGYLLVWDERAYWASVVAVNINGTAPVLGPFISKFLLGGPVFGAQTISRFYALHMLLIPGLIIALIFVHMWLVVKLGVTPWPGRPR